jgi:hypothetical protein
MSEIPMSESLKCTKERSTVYWDEVLAPALESGKTVLVVGHENNLRSLLMHLEGISPEDIVHLNIPRAVPLAYRLDANLKPMDRPDGKLDEATGYLRGEWLGGNKAVKEILERDYRQVYDTTETRNLEMGQSKDFWSMESVLDKPTPFQRFSGAEEDGIFGSAPYTPLPGVNHDVFLDMNEDGHDENRAAA